MPSPYGHQQGGTRRKKNRKGKSKGGRKSRVRRGSKLMMRGGQVVINWSDPFEYERRRNISVSGKLLGTLGGKQIVPVYYIKWTPVLDENSGAFEFDFSPISKIPAATIKLTVDKRASVIQKTKDLMKAYMTQVFGGDTVIPELFGNSVETTRIVMIVENGLITGIASKDDQQDPIAEVQSLKGSFDAFKQIVTKVNDATDESLFNKST